MDVIGTTAQSPVIRRILCALDFSTNSDQAFDYAQRLAQATGASLVLVHAFGVPRTADPAGQTVPADASIAERFANVTSNVPGIEISRVLHAGPAGEVICWVAQEQQCDLIVMGTHGRTGLRHLFFGSVAEYVLRRARSPVLTIREPLHQEAPLEEPMVLPLPAPRYM